MQDIKHNIGKYNATGMAGYVANGSTGESVLLSRKEVETVLIAVKESAAPGKLLIAGTGAESTAETIERTKRAAELGYHVALVKTPPTTSRFTNPRCTSRTSAGLPMPPIPLCCIPFHTTGIALRP